MSMNMITSNMISTGTIGGALIGSAAGVLLLSNGDVLGCSGIVSSTILSPIQLIQSSAMLWKPVFLLAMILTAFVTSRVLSTSTSNMAPATESAVLSVTAYMLAGFLVGFGTRLGNGCTSGHGICGLARLSKRSLAAVLTFMSTGILTAVYMAEISHAAHTQPLAAKHILIGSQNEDIVLTKPSDKLAMAVLAIVTGGILLVVNVVGRRKETWTASTRSDLLKLGPAIAVGAVFAIGLQYSGMSERNKVQGFLDVTRVWNGTWDATLLFVMGGGVVVSWLSYQFVKGHQTIETCPALPKPLVKCGRKQCQFEDFEVPTNTTIDRNLIVGGALFGIGWGIAGMCPGPAVVLAAQGVPAVVLYWWPSYFVGAYLSQLYKDKSSRDGSSAKTLVADVASSSTSNS